MKCYYFEFEKLIVYEPVCLKFGYTRNSVKTNTGLRRLNSHKIDKNTGVRCDQTVVLTGYYSKKDYPGKTSADKIFRC